MKKISLYFFIILLISGCTSKNKYLQPNGFYSNGEKYAYCRNPQLFNSEFINYVNKAYMLQEGEKIVSVSGNHSLDRKDLTVSVPLNCAGKFNMADGDIYDFNVTITIPAANSPTISKIKYKKINLTVKAQKNHTTDICLKNLNPQGSPGCLGLQNSDDYYEPFPTTEEDLKRNQKYMQTHQTYVCRTIKPSYAEGVRIREYIVTNPNQCN